MYLSCSVVSLQDNHQIGKESAGKKFVLFVFDCMTF